MSRPGRPALGHVRIHAAVSPAQRDAIDAEAKRLGVPACEVLRRAVAVWLTLPAHVREVVP